MRKLATAKRAQILAMLVEGMSMRAVTRITGVSINTVTKLLLDAGEAAAAYHDDHVRNVEAGRIECDEMWGFVYAKAKNVASAKAAPEGAGDAWAWTALDADSKMILSWAIGRRDAMTALHVMDDLRERLASRVQLTTDGLRAYVEAVEAAFGGEIDYAMLVKLFGKGGGESERRYSPAECIGARKVVVQGAPDPDKISTSYVERSNLSMRMGNRRLTRLTNAFSKSLYHHAAMLALYFLHYNFCRIHGSLRVTPAMAAGLDTTARDCEWIVGLVDARAPKPNRPKTYRKKSVSNCDTTTWRASSTYTSRTWYSAISARSWKPACSNSSTPTTPVIAARRTAPARRPTGRSSRIVTMAVQPVLRPLSLKEANQQFSRLIREVENGEAFVITRRGRPIARILPNDDVRTGDPHWVAAYERMKARLRKGVSLGGLRIEDRDALHDRDREFPEAK